MTGIIPPAAVPTRISAHPSVLIAQDATLQGAITLGQGCIVHPKATISAPNGGSVVIGDNCSFEELSVVRYTGTEEMRIGGDNEFLVGCHVESALIGNGNTFQPRCQVASDVEISDNCIVGAGVVLLPSISIGASEGGSTTQSGKERIPSRTVIHGSLAERKVLEALAEGSSGLEELEEHVRKAKLEFMRENLPKFVRMRAV